MYVIEKQHVKVWLGLHHPVVPGDSLEDGGNYHSLRQRGRQFLERVHQQVHFARLKAFLQFLQEDQTWKKMKSMSQPIYNYFVGLTNLGKETHFEARCRFLNDGELLIRKPPFQLSHYVVGLDHGQLHKLWQ